MQEGVSSLGSLLKQWEFQGETERFLSLCLHYPQHDH